MGKVLAAYGGGFKPPTKGHLEVVNKGLQQNPEITEVKILVGGGERNGFTQKQSVKIWNLYNNLNLISKPATVIPVSSPFNYYKEYLKDNPKDKVYVFIGSRPEEEKDQFDVKQRSEFVKKYSDNVIPVEVSTTGGVSGTLARNLFKTNIDDFRNMFPENLTDGDWETILNILGKKDLNESDPKKGTGKKPKGSSRRLYTDEDPKDTVGVKFSTRQDIVDTLNKKSFKAKSHARQSQIINLIHQRVRAAYGRAKDPAVKKRLKSGLDYITDKKEASKAKTQRLKKQKNENIDPKSQSKHKGKAAPFGSAYEPVNESENKEYFDFQIRIKNDSYDDLGTTFSNMGGRIQKSSTSVGGNPLIFNYRNVPSLVKAAFKAKNDNSEILIYNDEGKGKVYPLTIENIKLIKRPTSLNENATYSSKIDYKQQIKDLTKHMLDKGMNIQPLPKVIFKHSDVENASQFLGKTAYYDPNNMAVVLYTEGRHPKDIVRSFAHEMIHHIQNLEGRLGGINTTNTMEDDHLNDIEREAYTRGNMVFRNWTDNMDGEEVSSLNEGPQFGVLYHYTEFLLNILDDNMLRGPVSLTRSRDSFVKDWLGSIPILVLDKDKLRTKYKIRPYQDYDDDDAERSEDEMEEVIDRDVTNLSKYIIKVILPKPNEEYEDALKEKGIPYEIDKPLNEKKKPYKHKSGFDDKLGKDPFGLNQFAREIMGETEKPVAESLEEQEKVRIFNKNCGCDKTKGNIQ